ncbi:hypothetical protein SAMN05421641_12123 [Paracoccus thiocyanatus]|uniref:Uncharacterized protein n=1 Tax=Paracoccus thiocyanatus TaxID=34006 RepID=A0A1N6XIF6_9RHOB|nr:hypothetical protein [Paracoccus thiocyanatus]SIR02112.1 hypothetical protein SAMN05421641_12123 [Paracoccus thiocyanatus]
MPRPIRCLLLVFLLLAGPASASPWPRAVKGVFLALSVERDAAGHSYTGLYGEVGRRPRLTMGVELGRSSAGETSSLVWLQRALDRGRGPDRWAAAIGLGAVERDGQAMPLAQVALGWGRTFDSLPVLRRARGGGWVSAELRYKVVGALKDEEEMAALAAQGASSLRYLTPEATAKAEVTVGWHMAEALMLVHQLRLEDREDTGFASKIAVSAVRDLLGPLKLELGLIAPLSGPGERAAKLGLWVEF